MTTYILESGNLKSHPQKAKDFYETLLKGLGQNPTVLLCFFARFPEDIEEHFLRYTELFSGAYPKGIVPKHVNAVPDNFVEQIGNADVIEIHGGHTKTLKKYLSGYDLPKLFKGKVVAGHSAGSNILSESYWSPGQRECHDGFGILPIKFISHFGSDYGSDDPRGPIDWRAAQLELTLFGDRTVPVYAMKEGEFAVFTT